MSGPASPGGEARDTSSDDPIPSWPRPHLSVGAGGFAPLLYYRVYGDVNLRRPLSAAHYRCAQVPPGVRLSRVAADAHADAFTEILAEPMSGILRRSLPDLAALVAGSRNACVIHGSPEQSDTLDYFRDTIGLIQWMLDGGGTFVYGPLQLRCWTAEQWRREVFEPAAPQPLLHVVTLVSAEADGAARWYHTRGMQKFGRPDVSVRGVPPDFAGAAADLCARLIVMQAEGAVIPEGQPIRMRGLPPGGTLTHQGSFDDPDFNNVHVEAVFPTWRPGA